MNSKVQEYLRKKKIAEEGLPIMYCINATMETPARVMAIQVTDVREDDTPFKGKRQISYYLEEGAGWDSDRVVLLEGTTFADIITYKTGHYRYYSLDKTEAEERLIEILKRQSEIEQEQTDMIRIKAELEAKYSEKEMELIKLMYTVIPTAG